MVTDNIPRRLFPFQPHLLALLRELSHEPQPSPSLEPFLPLFTLKTLPFSFFSGDGLFFHRLFSTCVGAAGAILTHRQLRLINRTMSWDIYGFIDGIPEALRLPQDAILAPGPASKQTRGEKRRGGVIRLYYSISDAIAWVFGGEGASWGRGGFPSAVR